MLLFICFFPLNFSVSLSCSLLFSSRIRCTSRTDIINQKQNKTTKKTGRETKTHRQWNICYFKNVSFLLLEMSHANALKTVWCSFFFISFFLSFISQMKFSSSARNKMFYKIENELKQIVFLFNFLGQNNEIK